MTSDQTWLDELLRQVGYGRLNLNSSPQANNTSFQYHNQAQSQQPQKQQGGGGGGMDQYQRIMDMFQGTGSGAPNTYQGTFSPSGYDGGATMDFSTIAGNDGGSSWWSSIGDWFSSLGSGSGGESAGSGAGTAAYVVAAIIAQMILSNNTDTVVEGQEAGHWFTGIDKGKWDPAPMNEPWLSFTHDKLGWEPTAGEKWDAAFRNDDWGAVLKRTPAAADYWADPIRSWLGYDTWNNLLGEWSDDKETNKILATLIDPIGGILNQFDEWF